MHITIKEATKADAALIAELSRKTFYETFAADNTEEDMQKFLREQFTTQALMDEVGAEGNIFLLAYADNDIAGYARLRIATSGTKFNGKPSIEIARIYALQNMIGVGVGRALMQACIDYAQAAGKKIIWLGVWEKNERAIAFYKKWGFEKFDEHDFVLGNDVQRDWLMKKEIEPTF